jgi:hypothetical protein
MEELIAQLEKEPIPIQFEYAGKFYAGEAIPVPQTCMNGVCSEFDVSLNDEAVGIIKRLTSSWKIDGAKDQKLVTAIGKQIEAWYK